MQQTTITTPDILLAALAGLRVEEQRIKGLIAQVQTALNGDAPAEAVKTTPGKPRRKFSAATRRRMAASQKARWAAKRAPAKPAAKRERAAHA